MNCWSKTKSKNYIFHYSKNSLAERDLDLIIKTQENCHKSICKALGVSMDIPIKYFLCDSPEAVGNIYGSIHGDDFEPCNGFAMRPNEIYAVYNETVKCIGFHEDAHIISYHTLNRPPQVFIREGLVMYFDKVYWGISNDAWVYYLLQNNKFISLKDLIIDSKFYGFSDKLTYPIAGSFVSYLISICGLDKFKKFYMNLNENFEQCFKNSFGMSLEEVERDFTDYILLIKPNKEILTLIAILLS